MCLAFDKNFVEMFIVVSEAVSYTHLDVYKRQVENSRPFYFGEDRLREKGSLPATFYVVTREMFS